jgi:hypothetical protein
MRSNRFWAWMVLAYVAGLGLLAAHFRNALNSDGVAYLRLASYYADGKWDLAVSGYWGPLASWGMAPLLKIGLPPLLVARLFMAVSAGVFLLGCRAVYRAFELPELWERAGMILAAMASLYWSVQFITPDLLLGGLLCFATSRLTTGAAFRTTPAAVGTGLLWGLAYLTKAVALPLAILVVFGFGLLALRKGPAPRAALAYRAGVILAAFALLAGPWVLTLSLKYRTPTFSTSARIAHALSGPPDEDRYHPIGRTLHRPEPGRITSWEDPSRMAYHYWSPLESRAYAWHQAKTIARNFITCLALLASLNLAWPPLFFALLLRLSGTWPAGTERCFRALLLPGLLVLIYVPCYITLAEQRYFYAAFPFLFAAVGAGLLGTAEPPGRKPSVSAQRWAWWFAVLGAVLPLVAAVLIIADAPMRAGGCAADLARRLERCRLGGPVAGSGMLPGGRTGLYIAFLLNQPWYGDERQPAPADLKASGARLVVTRRDSELAAALDRDAGFENLDRTLFGDAAEAGRCPLKIYQVLE